MNQDTTAVVYTAEPLSLWLAYPAAWSTAAKELTSAALSDCELSSSSRRAFGESLAEVDTAARQMLLARRKAGAMPEPAGTLLVTEQYAQAVRRLAQDLQADCQVSSASTSAFSELLATFAQQDAPFAGPPAKSPAMTLKFEVFGDPEDHCRRAKTPFGTYELHGFPKGWAVTFLFGEHSGRRVSDRASVSLERAIALAQADFDRRVAACLDPDALEALSRPHPIPSATPPWAAGAHHSAAATDASKVDSVMDEPVIEHVDAATRVTLWSTPGVVVAAMECPFTRERFDAALHLLRRLKSHPLEIAAVAFAPGGRLPPEMVVQLADHGIVVVRDEGETAHERAQAYLRKALALRSDGLAQLRVSMQVKATDEAAPVARRPRHR